MKALAIILGILTGATGSVAGSSTHYKTTPFHVTPTADLQARDEDQMYRMLYILIDAYTCKLVEPDVEWLHLSRAWRAMVWSGFPIWDEDKLAETLTLRVGVRLHTPPEDCAGLAEQWNGGPER